MRNRSGHKLHLCQDIYAPLTSPNETASVHAEGCSPGLNGQAGADRCPPNCNREQ